MQRILEEGRKVQSGPVTAGRKEETGAKAEEAHKRKEESERKGFLLPLVM